jgi:hypothetical protein
MAEDRRLRQAIKERRDHLELNGGADDGYEVTDDDALDDLLEECGRMGDGYCTQAGTEYCDFECPFSR